MVKVGDLYIRIVSSIPYFDKHCIVEITNLHTMYSLVELQNVSNSAKLWYDIQLFHSEYAKCTPLSSPMVVYNLPNFSDQTSEMIYTNKFKEDSHVAYTIQKKCTCGIYKTYGPDCDTSFHSSWCELLEKT